MAQPAPFQASMKASRPQELDQNQPTPRHISAEAQETLDKRPLLPAGTGSGWTVQLDPFQRSTRLRTGPVEET